VVKNPAARRAETPVPIHPDIAARWSPRVFEPDAVLTPEDLVAVVAVARWAATWGHRQPVRFLVGLRGDETNTAISEPLKRGNGYARQPGHLSWCAPTRARTSGPRGTPRSTPVRRSRS